MSNIRKSSEVDLVSEYIHVDNGGTTFALVEFEPESAQGPHQTAIVISDSYLGYSESNISLFHLTNDPANLRKIAEFFTKAAIALDKKIADDKLNY